MHSASTIFKYQILITAGLLGIILVITRNETMLIKNHSKENKNRTTVILEEDKYADYSFCTNNEVKEYKDWRGHFLTTESNSSEIFIPNNFEEAPVGFAASVPTSYLIEENDFCTKRPFIKAIVYVHTAIKDIEKRALTRATWGRASDEIGVVYVIGKAKNKEEEDILARESPMHRDIIQGNYTDLYQFLVYKNYNAMYWILKNCNQVKCVVHSDDDVIFDVTKFLQFVDSDIKGNVSNKIFCNLMCSSVVVRDSGSKWAVSEKLFPYKYYPIHCMGNFWFTTIDTIKKLLDATPLVQFTWIDDTFITGLLAERAEVQRYRIDIPSNFQLEDVGKVYGWREMGNVRMEYWNNIVSYYKKYFTQNT